jgi:hypothetical protein
MILFEKGNEMDTKVDKVQVSCGSSVAMSAKLFVDFHVRVGNNCMNGFTSNRKLLRNFFWYSQILACFVR